MKRFFILFFIFLFFNSYSQFLKHEVGVSLGATSMQTDYGRRNDFESAYGNVGFGASLFYYLSFDEVRVKWNDRSTFMKNHFKLKLEANYMKDNFVHKGNYKHLSPKMAAMKGSTKLYNLGGQIEYFIFDFIDQRMIEPYFYAGMHYVIYDPELETVLGDWRDKPSLIPTAYLNGGINMEQNKTQSISFGLGTRFTPNKLTFVFDLRWQKFQTDNIEGLSPMISANKYRDWLFYAQAGMVFRLN